MTRRQEDWKKGRKSAGHASVPSAQGGQSSSLKPKLTTGDRLTTFLIAAGLAILTPAVFWQVLSNKFISIDDDAYLFANKHIQAGLTLKNAIWAFTTNYAANWHPLTWLSHMADISIFKFDPGMHHAVSLAFHTVNAIVLFLLLKRMTGSMWKSAFVAALFAIHPLHVESVAWAAERKDVLSTLFWLLTMWAYVGYAERPNVGRYALTALFLILGLMAKPMLVTLPLVLLLLDYWPLRRVESRESAVDGENATSEGRRPLMALIVEKIPLFVISAASCAVTFWAQKAGGAVRTMEQYSLPSRIGNALVGYCEYLIKMVWPLNLTIMYPHSRHGIPSWIVAAAVVFLVAVTIAVFRLGRRTPYLKTGWLWYLITLIPVIGIIQVGDQAIADRYTYVPLIGIFVIIAWGIPELALKLGLSAPGNRWALGVAFTAVIAVFSVITYNQLVFWENGKTILEHAIDVTGKNFLAENNLANILFLQGDQQGSLEHYRKAYEIDPDGPMINNNLGYALQLAGDDNGAVRLYKRAIELRKDDTNALMNLGSMLAKRNDRVGAIKLFRTAISYNPENAESRDRLGRALGMQGNVSEAIEEFSKAVELSPENIDYHQDLIKALYQSNRFDDVERELTALIKVHPNLPPAYQMLGMLYYRKQDYAQVWEFVHKYQSLGGTVDPSFLETLSKKMPEPSR